MHKVLSPCALGSQKERWQDCHVASPVLVFKSYSLCYNWLSLLMVIAHNQVNLIKEGNDAWWCIKHYCCSLPWSVSIAAISWNSIPFHHDVELSLFVMFECFNCAALIGEWYQYLITWQSRLSMVYSHKWLAGIPGWKLTLPLSAMVFDFLFFFPFFSLV